MNKIILNRTQLQQLTKILSHFEDVKDFTLESDSTTGIGPTVRVKFTLFSNNDSSVDITDVTTW